jgi:hypothetical protein
MCVLGLPMGRKHLTLHCLQLIQWLKLGRDRLHAHPHLALMRAWLEMRELKLSLMFMRPGMLQLKLGMHRRSMCLLLLQLMRMMLYLVLLLSLLRLTRTPRQLALGIVVERLTRNHERCIERLRGLEILPQPWISL